MITLDLKTALRTPAITVHDGKVWRESLVETYARWLRRWAWDIVYHSPRLWWQQRRRRQRSRMREMRRLQRALAVTQSQLVVQRHGLVLGSHDESHMLKWRSVLDRYSRIVVDREIYDMARWLIVKCSKDSASALTLAVRYRIAHPRMGEYREVMEMVHRKILGNLEPRRLPIRIR